MSDALIAGMARALCVSDIRRGSACRGQCRDKTRQARAAWAHALKRLFEPSGTMRLAGDLEADGQLHGCAISVAEIWREMLRAFALELGLEPPGGQERASAAEEGDGADG